MPLPEFVNCSFCNKKMEFMKESHYVSHPLWDYEDDMPLCEQHFDKYRSELEKVFDYYTRTECKKSEALEYDKAGRIKRICFRPKCNQPIWVREYSQYSLEHPLFCPVCWEYVYAIIHLLMIQRNVTSNSDRMIIQKEVISNLLNPSDDNKTEECAECILITKKKCSEHCG